MARPIPATIASWASFSKRNSSCTRPGLTTSMSQAATTAISAVGRRATLPIMRPTAPDALFALLFIVSPLP